MATKTTFANGSLLESIEVSNTDYNKVKQILAQRPLMVILAELETSLTAAKKGIDQTVANIEARHAGKIRDAEKAVNQARFDLQQADNELKEAARAGKYSLAPALEAKKVELNQAILQAELQLAVGNEALAVDRGSFLVDVQSGHQGSGATVDGIPYKSFLNITRAIIFEQANTSLVMDITGFTYQQARQAGDQVNGARWAVQDAQARLNDFRAAAAARYSGAGVKAAAAAHAPQPANDAQANFERAWGTDQPAQPQPAPARRPGDWGEVQLGNRYGR